MYHIPVLLHECIEALQLKADGIYVDATFGGGGHSKEMLKLLGKNGKLIVFDQDPDAAKNVPDDDRITFVAANFRHLKRFLKLHQCAQVDGILADLGVSSYQFDTGERGFSYRFEGPLDMRMNVKEGVTAADILNTYDEKALQQLLSEYGEVTNSKTLAIALVEARSRKKYETINDLLAVVEMHVKGNKYSYYGQVFQALRIEVNEELIVLKEFLYQCADVIKPGGILAVLTFHSLEERLVKNYMKKGSFDGEHVKDDFGIIYLPFKPVNKKPIEASVEELEVNSRSRSAKLRIAVHT
jgi:16S rRNA (cytosine1402-N4)-methyltransferase